MSVHLREQIWREDVYEQVDATKDSAKVLHDWVERAQFQGAPAELVERLKKTRNLCAEALDQLTEMLPWFPKQPDE